MLLLETKSKMEYLTVRRDGIKERKGRREGRKSERVRQKQKKVTGEE